MTTEDAGRQDDSVLVVVDSGNKPAADAEAQKSDKQETPAPGAEDKKPDSDGQQQSEQRRESRRARARAEQARQLGRAEAERDFYKQQLEKAQQPSSDAGKQDAGEPKRENFESYEAYLDARADWRADQRAKQTPERSRQEAPRQERQDQRQAADDPSAKAWGEREQKFSKETKDYTESVTDYLEADLGQLSMSARQAIVDSEVGPQLLYHLSKNPAVHDRIAGLSGARQVAELVKLEDELTKPAAKKTTDAPPPPNPLPGGKSAGNGFNENMSDADYRALRKAQGARWAR